MKNLDRCLDTHLNSALHNIDVYFSLQDLLHPKKSDGQLSNRRKKFKIGMKTLLEHARISPADVAYNPQTFLGLLTGQMNHQQVKNGSGFTLELEKHLLVAATILQESSSQFLDSFHQQDLNGLNWAVMGHGNFPALKNLYGIREILEQGVMLTAKPSRHRLTRELQDWKDWLVVKMDAINPIFKTTTLLPGFEFYLTPQLMLIRDDLGSSWVGTRGHFLMLSDCVSQRWGCLLSSVLANILNRNNYPSWDQLIRLFSWGDSILLEYGNEGYRALKMWESIAIGHILAVRKDPHVDEKAFLSEMRDTFLTTLPDLPLAQPGRMEQAYVQASELLIGCETLNQMAQLFGLYRIWGHPTVDVEAGIKKVRKVACKIGVFDYVAIAGAVIKWRETFCINFYTRHNRWPTLTIPNPLPGSYLCDVLTSGIPLNSTSPEYNPDHWLAIRFSKNFEIQEKYELSEMLSDKATSLNHDDLVNALLHGGIGKSTERSVIIRWLENNYQNPKAFLQDICENGFGSQETVIGVHEKEREMSPEPRLFALLTIRKRLYVVLTEALIAEHLLPYFPEITMTEDAISLRERIQKNTQKLIRNKPEIQSIVVNMDFMKWNSNMRKEETFQIFSDMDHLFGLENCISRTHSMFTDSIIYAANGALLPDVDRNTGTLVLNSKAWNNHLGGLEGLRQKGWTIFTVCLLKYVAQESRVECSIMGQGDNQVLILTYRDQHGTTFKTQHEAFMNRMCNFLSTIGPPLKKEETWSSSSFFIYGKYPVYDGEPLSMSLKKICRTMRLTNDGMQNLSSTLSSIAANCAAAVDSDYDPVIPVFIGLLESSGALELHITYPFYSAHPLFNPSHKNSYFVRLPLQGKSHLYEIKIGLLQSELRKMSSRVLMILLQIPSILGGYPVISFRDLVVHGFGDPLTLGLNGVGHIIKTTPDETIRKYLISAVNPRGNPEISSEMLIQDPLSLNLLQASSAGDKVKRMVFDFLTTQKSINVVNETFLTFLKLAKTSQQTLSDTLFKMTPLHPKIASALVESTYIGRANRMISKINKTNVLISLMLRDRVTTQRLLQEEIGYDDREEKPERSFYELFGSFEKNFFMGVLMTLSHPLQDTDHFPLRNDCSMVQAVKLRTATWGKVLHGLEVAVPWELLKMYPSHTSNCHLEGHPNIDLGYFLTTVLGTSENTKVNNKGVGSYGVYFGSKTKNKVKYEGKNIIQSAPPILKNILHMACLIGWGTEPESGVSKLIQLIAESMTDLNIMEVAPTEGEISGSLGHRWDDVKTTRPATLAVLWKYASMIVSTTNNFHPENAVLESGTDDLKIHFQAIFLWVSSVLSFQMNRHGIPTDTMSYHCHVACRSCIQPLDKTMIELDLPDDIMNSLPMLTPQQDNLYCWVSSRDLGYSGGQKMDQFSTSNTFDQLSVPSLQVLYDSALAYKAVTESQWLQANTVPSDHRPGFQLSLSSVLKVKTTLFFDFLAEEICLKYGWNHFHDLIRHYPATEEWYNHIIASVSSMPTSWFFVLTNFLLNIPVLEQLAEEHPTVLLPLGNPSTVFQQGCYFRSLILSIVKSPSFFHNWVQRLMAEIPEPLVLKTGLMHHPLVKRILGERLEGKSGTRNLEDVMLLRDELTVATDLKISSVTNLLEVWSNRPLHASIQFNKVLSRYLEKGSTTFYRVTPDGIAGLLGRRIRPIMLTDTGETSLTINLNSLPSSISPVMVADPIEQFPLNTYVFTLRSVPLGKTIELNKHLLKPLGGSTSAPYKLLSVLQYCISKHHFSFTDEDVICAVGDGSGGFGATLAKSFPRNPLFLNTLITMENLQALGTDRPLPASLINIKGLVSRVMGVNLMEEGKTDLTKDKDILAMAANIGKSGLIVCDAEGGGWGDPQKGCLLSQNLTELGRLTDCPTVILKTYYSQPVTMVAQVHLGLDKYTECHVLRSRFSSSGSTELYLVFRHLRPSAKGVTFKMSDQEIHITHPFSHSLAENLWSKTEQLDNTPNILMPTVADDYSLSLSTPIQLRAHVDSLVYYLKTSIAFGSSPFPDCVILNWSSKFNLPKFSFRNPEKWVDRRFTSALQQKLIFDYLVGCFLSETKSQSGLEPVFGKLRLVIATWNLWVFKAWSGSMSFTLLPPQITFIDGFSIVKIQIAKIFKRSTEKKLLTFLAQVRFLSPDLSWFSTRWSPKHSWGSLPVPMSHPHLNPFLEKYQTTFDTERGMPLRFGLSPIKRLSPELLIELSLVQNGEQWVDNEDLDPLREQRRLDTNKELINAIGKIHSHIKAEIVAAEIRMSQVVSSQ